MLEFFLAILLMLVSAWVLGELLHRVGQPALVGQLFGGVIVGPSVLNLVQPTAALTEVQNLAVFFIMLLTGLAVRPDRIIAAGKRGAVVSSIAFVVPFASGFLIARYFGVDFVSSLTVGLTVSITAVPVNAIIMMEIGLLDTNLGATVIAAGVIDDILSFIIISLIQQVGTGPSTAGEAAIEWSLLKVGVFLGALIISEHFLRANVGRIRSWAEKAPVMGAEGSYIVIVILVGIGISLLAEWSGMQFVVGAFFAGFLLSELASGAKLEKAIEVIRGQTFGFLGPFAFAFIGTELALSSIAGILPLVGTLLVVAVLSKFFGGYLGAALCRFTPRESVAIGFLMNSRGFVELVIAATAYQLALLSQELFSMVVVVGIITTIISPIATRLVTRKMKSEAAS